MTTVIIGLGLIGGSVGIRLQKSDWEGVIIGVDQNSQNAQKALELGLVHQIGELEEILPSADLILICVPVNAALNLLPGIMDKIGPEAIVMDMGSTKADICDTITSHLRREAFVATHPIAGTENSGPKAAFASLFEGKTGILCDVEKSGSKALEMAKDLYGVLGMSVVEMSSKEHDLHIAYVSHLSHITSFVLGQTVLEIEKDEENIFNMAGSGFASTVRLAKSSPAMWAPIFAQNKKNVSKSLDAYIENLKVFKDHLDQGDAEAMFESMEKTNKIRAVLEGIDIQSLNARPKIKDRLDTLINQE